MLKASFNLPNNTLVTIEGAKEDIQDLLDYYSDSHPADSSHSPNPKLVLNPQKKNQKKKD